VRTIRNSTAPVDAVSIMMPYVAMFAGIHSTKKPMTILLAVDPGLLHPAAALFVGGNLVKASRVKIPKGVTTKDPILERCRAIAIAIADYAGCIPQKICVEYPQIYTADKSKGDPNKLVPLAAIGASLAGLYPHVPVLSPLPREWTGNVPKAEDGDPWQSPRGIRVWDRLSSAERLNVVPSHDAIDSVGLGLYALGRFSRRRVYSDGST
jgi:hypothetical protein